MIIGSHVSFTKEKQLLGSVMEALSYKANTFMFYTGAPQNTTRIPINTELTLHAHNLMKKENINIDNVIVHAPYIINLANANNFEFNVTFLKEEIVRVEKLGISKLVLHPGSHIGLGRDIGISNIIKTLNEVITDSQQVVVCLELMAGKGTEIGTCFEDLRDIINGITNQSKIAVCLDTCHLNDAGFDLAEFSSILECFDEIIGISNLAVIHINDSKNSLNSHKDRHENIGYGHIGYNILYSIVHNDKIKNVPKILETPYVGEYPPYKFEIEMLRRNKFNENLLDDVISCYKDYKNK